MLLFQNNHCIWTKPIRAYNSSFRPHVPDSKFGFLDWRAKMRVIQKFVIASLFMWATPIAILHAFNHNLLPGTVDLSPYSVTLVSGFLAVISVNVVIAFYIYLAMREPEDKHEPDPKFVTEAKDIVKQFTGDAQQSSQPLKKQQ